MEAEDSSIPSHVLPCSAQLSHALENLHKKLPSTGLGLDLTQQHLTQHIAPALNGGSQSSRYYGFVTGGATPAAMFADNMVTEYDQNVQVHLPNETIATDVEAAALDLVCDLLHLDAQEWPHKTFTTGATSSNINGLACGREYIISAAATRNGNTAAHVSSLGLITAMRTAGIDQIQILTCAPHSSLRKAASIIGLGHDSVKDIGLSSHPHRIDLVKLESMLHVPRTASIIAVSCSEVNSGLFATSENDMLQLRQLADKHLAWIHTDAAFGLLARILPTDNATYTQLLAGTKDIHLSDSIAADAHKLLNVPYDCGILFSRHLSTATAVFQNPGAPYLNNTTTTTIIPSPLNIGIENSRRFRALPVYANLIAYGRTGFVQMLQRQIALARKIATWLLLGPGSQHYDLLPLLPPSCNPRQESQHDPINSIYIIVLFRAKNAERNKVLVRDINATRRIYVSGTSWQGLPACRFAISNWKVDVERDWPVVRHVLESVLLKRLSILNI
jgi:glutamate/tyrosine decarboxylase-like PLP-dependent enzyme